MVRGSDGPRLRKTAVAAGYPEMVVIPEYATVR